MKRARKVEQTDQNNDALKKIYIDRAQKLKRSRQGKLSMEATAIIITIQPIT